jgi:hypothetical protein
MNGGNLHVQPDKRKLFRSFIRLGLYLVYGGVPMSDFETGMRYVRATLGFEGLVLTEEEEKLLERRFHGEITEEEYIQKAFELSLM